MFSFRRLRSRVRKLAGLIQRASRQRTVIDRGPRDRPAPGGVTEVLAFGSNPGALRMLVHPRGRMAVGRPLVILLHGCGQKAAAFAAESGWLALADELGFALVMPEQVRENNPGGCFNWFRPEDVRRGGGEAMSIRQMLRAAIARYACDPRRVFIVGFSAGGGMAAAMLAAYPAVFAAGAVVAGMPVGCAKTPMGAMLAMRRATASRSRRGLADDARAVTKARSRKVWPRLSIWQGDRDQTINPANAEALAAQWGELHGQSDAPSADEQATSFRRRAWGAVGRPPAVELWTIAGLGHGFPIDPRSPAGGRAGPWVVNADLSATRRIADFWLLSR